MVQNKDLEEKIKLIQRENQPNLKQIDLITQEKDRLLKDIKENENKYYSLIQADKYPPPSYELAPDSPLEGRGFFIMQDRPVDLPYWTTHGTQHLQVRTVG